MLDPAVYLNTLDPILPLLVGALLLIAGRHLFWLALGAVGFLLGLELARELVTADSEMMRLGLALALGLAGVVVAFMAQRLAVTLAGILAGGLGVLWLAQPWAALLGAWIWALGAVGALVGIVLAAAVFRAALVLVSAWIGAGLVLQSLEPPDRYRLFIFAGLWLAGVAVQARRRKRARAR